MLWGRNETVVQRNEALVPTYSQWHCTFNHVCVHFLGIETQLKQFPLPQASRCWPWICLALPPRTFSPTRSSPSCNASAGTTWFSPSWWLATFPICSKTGSLQIHPLCLHHYHIAPNGKTSGEMMYTSEHVVTKSFSTGPVGIYLINRLDTERPWCYQNRF